MVVPVRIELTLGTYLVRTLYKGVGASSYTKEPKSGAQGESRTHNTLFLRQLPLPLGYKRMVGKVGLGPTMDGILSSARLPISPQPQNGSLGG